MTTADTLARFRSEYQIPRSITPQRQGQQLRELQRVAASLDHPLIEITQQDVLNYLGAQLTRGLTPNTVRFIHMMIRSFITWGEMAGLIPVERANMVRLIGMPRGSTGQAVPNPYTQTEVRSFREIVATKYPPLPEYGKGSRALPRYLQGKTDALRGPLWRHARRLQYEAQVSLALEMALRGIEIHRLSIDAAHYENDALVVHTAKQGPGKQRLRSVPWTPHAHERMQDWLDFRKLLSPKHESLWLILDYHERGDEQLAPMTLDQFHRTLSVFGRGWHWHRFRHTSATEWLRSGMPLDKLQVMMGHARLEQTQAYTQILKGDITDAMAGAQEAFSKRMGLAA